MMPTAGSRKTSTRRKSVSPVLAIAIIAAILLVVVVVFLRALAPTKLAVPKDPRVYDAYAPSEKQLAEMKKENPKFDESQLSPMMREAIERRRKSEREGKPTSSIFSRGGGVPGSGPVGPPQPGTPR